MGCSSSIPGRETTQGTTAKSTGQIGTRDAKGDTERRPTANRDGNGSGSGYGNGNGGSPTPTTSSKPKAKSRGSWLGRWDDKHKGMNPDEKRTVKNQEKWLKKEKKQITANESEVTKEWEDLFAGMMKGKEKEELDKKELKQVFHDMGRRIDEDMFDKVFAIFDANGDGLVNHTEFMVAMLFLSYRGSAKDKVQLAFRLFDTDRNNTISQKEFSEMIAALIGNDLEVLLRMQEGHDVFKEQLKAEYAHESLEFLDEIKAIKAEHPTAIPVSKAREIVEEFIKEDAPRQVNINDRQRTQAVDDVAAAESESAESMPWTSLNVAYNEVVGLLVRDKLERFKRKIRESPDFANRVFESQGVVSSHGMTQEQFRSWANKHPNLFNFLDELQAIIVEEERKKVIAASKIQRLIRSRSSKRTTPTRAAE